MNESKFLEDLHLRGYFHSSFASMELQEAINNNAVESLLEFFRSPKDAKERAMSKDRARRGYSPSDTENFATLVGEKKGNDHVEKFRVGPEIDEELKVLHHDYFSAKSSRVHFFPNNWEQAYIQFNLHTSILSLNYYAIREKQIELRIAEHKDVSFFTIVSNLTPNISNNAKLQVFDCREGEWRDISIAPGEFVILVGEYLEYASGGQFQAVLHRVVEKIDEESTNDRISFAFFVAPNYDAMIDLREENHEASPLMLYDEWRKWKISEAMKIGKK